MREEKNQESQPLERVTEPADRLLTVKEAARILRISTWTLYERFIHTRELTPIKIGRKTLIKREDLDDLINRLEAGETA